MKPSFLTIVLFLSYTASAQTKGYGFFSGLQISISHSFEYDQLLYASSEELTEYGLSQISGHEEQLGLSGYQNTEELLINYWGYPESMNCMGFGIMLSELSPDYHNFNIELLKTLPFVDNLFTVGFELGFRMPASATAQFDAERLSFVNYNNPDSLLIQDIEDPNRDTLLLFPAVSFVNFGMQANMLTIGFNLNVMAAETANKRWRLYLNTSYRAMYSQSKSINVSTSPQQYYYDFYTNEFPDSNWMNTYYSTTHLNATDRQFTSYAIQSKPLRGHSVLVGLGIERSMFSDHANWGVKFQFGSNSYYLDHEQIFESAGVRFGGYLAFKLGSQGS